MSEKYRMNIKLLGKVLGTAEGWEEPDTFVLQFMQIELNELGNKFVRGHAQNTKYCTLQIVIESGTVELISPFTAAVAKVNPDWSVFNV